LLDYVPKVKEKLEKIVILVSNSYQKKKDLMIALKERLKTGLLEYDIDQFSKAAFLLEEKGFFFIVHLTIKSSFPATQPIITTQSVYHFVQMHTPFHKIYQDYPYSPRWSGPELVHRILLFLRDALDQFKVASL
ncbi:hypothetical protein, partial [Salmonella sp. s51228]|uniref:hypothetical protein n=1 Tax=Salmonella sp. s51228 TaxID=3159652 RepID=UPI00397F2D84